MTSPKQASAERRATLLSAGARAAKSFASILDMNELLNRTVDIIVNEYGFYYAGVFLNDYNNKWALLKAGYGSAGDTMVAAGHKLEIGGNSMIGDSVANRTARISLDVGEEAVFFKNPNLPETRSEMGLPLIVRETAIGALTVQSKEEAAFTQEDIEALQAMADQLAIAIDNAHLHQKAEKRARYFEAANKVGHGLATILDLDQLLPQTVDVIVDAYKFYYAGVFLIDKEGQWAVLRAGHGDAGKAMLDAEHKLEVGGNSMIGDAVANRIARISLDVGEEAVFFKNPHLPNTRSEMALPLTIGKEVLGAVTVQSEEEAAFSEEDISTLQTMADHLAIAIKNAYTLHELENAHAEVLRKKTFEALATATTQAIHWIGNKALPITTTVARLNQDLEENILDVESFREDLEMIDTSAQLIVQVKEALIGPAREEEPRTVMVGDVAAAAAAYMNIKDDQFEISVEGSDLIMGDSTQLARVFENLYKNSLEANASKINVKVTSISDVVQITVADDGDGIPEAMIGKIWASFITTKGPNFTGMGLPAALHVLGQHAGSIAVDSVEGKGATFTIFLPLHTMSEDIDLSAGAQNVMIISGETLWAKHTLEILEAAGKNVTLQSDTTGADISEMILVDDSSVDVARILGDLKEMGANQKTAVMAAAVRVERITAYMKFQIRDVCLKPYSKKALSEILQTA